MKRSVLPWVLTAACGGGASVEGQIGGRSFQLATVFGWIDATEAEVDPSAGKIIFKARSRKDLHVVMSGATYNPEQDVRFLTAAELADIGLQQVQNGYVELRVTNFDAVGAGAILTDPDPNGGGDAPELDANHRLAAVRVEADAIFPMEALLFGSRTTYTLTVEEVGRASGESVSGTLVISVQRADGDPTVVQTGSITLDFTASLIGERIAECNAGEGRSQSCEL
jgi:hypothetical protein